MKIHQSVRVTVVRKRTLARKPTKKQRRQRLQQQQQQPQQLQKQLQHQVLHPRLQLVQQQQQLRQQLQQQVLHPRRRLVQQQQQQHQSAHQEYIHKVLLAVFNQQVYVQLGHLFGTYNTNGINATNSVVVNAIATALRTSSAYSGTSNGVTWYVGTCGSGMELASTAVCACATGYSIRPCIGGLNWGGVDSTSCSAPSQVMTLSFQ
ncbi:unnamed protein product [Adineta steineri]|uniref:Uncharacterized protein n=1 Tax=Adineta steineri TaxID=433720 RepID=A0A815RGE0_9BILA|nr:unnamed protein product [Adineta steineri]